MNKIENFSHSKTKKNGNFSCVFQRIDKKRQVICVKKFLGGKDYE